MAGHTPGPWTIDRWGGVIAPDGKRVLVDGVSLPTGNNPRIAEAEANARLVAAAPELREVAESGLTLAGGWREAIVELEDFCSDPARLKNMLAAADQLDEWVRRARDAVARAEGRTA